MARALELARKGIYTTDPNPNVGCVIVAPNGTVLGEGWHQKAGEAHAEIHALKQATDSAAGAIVYVTLEPCSHHGRTPPCADALVAAGVAKVICAMQDPNPQVAGAGLEKLRAAGIETACGLMEAEARELNRGFVKRMQTGRPWVSAKLAVSMDGRTALKSGESKWITGAAARGDVQRLRAVSSAILTGIGTVLADDPRLDVRDAAAGLASQPQRIVADSALRMPVDAAMLRAGGPVRIFHSTGSAGREEELSGRNVLCKRLPAKDGRVNLAAILDVLGSDGCNRLLVEAGPTLNGALLEAGLIDEVIVYQAATVMGADAMGMFACNGINTMEDLIPLHLVDVRHLGDDLRLTYRVV
jgi:diaminohydroxyphosphoribosylaminopyrimidine deaminase/5-amino-6-(5-phosphoribosylamino)uracil reductase